MENERVLLKQFGRHLVELRRRHVISQERLALESGVSRSYMSGIERGVRNISLTKICELANALGVPPATLVQFGDSKNGSKPP